MSAEDTVSTFGLSGKSVYVAGHRGMVGSALVRRLNGEGCEVIVTDRSELDLRNQDAVNRWFADRQPDVVVLAAARVGGILANATSPADFLFDNLAIQNNVISSAFTSKVQKLLFLGSSCIYPKMAPQPIKEEALLTGPLETTNEAYAIAKIAGLKLCQAYRRQHGADFISAMPTNLYGPGDNFDLNGSHVIPALMRKVHAAKVRGDGTLTIWGSGRPLREFLHVDDCADALVLLLKQYSDDSHVNVGSGREISIYDLARLIASKGGADLRIETDDSKPDGTPRKLMDVSRLFATGWRPKYDLTEGLTQTWSWFNEHVATGNIRL